MRNRLTVFLALTGLALPGLLSSQTLRTARTIWASDPADVPAMAQSVDSMLRSGALAFGRTQRDGQIPGRVHERLNQYHDGVRVFGGQLVWQKESGRVLSVTGNLYDGVDVDTQPTLSADDAVRRGLAVAAPGSRVAGRIELVILPLSDRFVLTYYFHVRGADRSAKLEAMFVDARSGTIVLRYNDLRKESEVALGIGTWSDQKKMSVESASGTNRAVDQLRPFGIKTYDVHFDYDAWNYYMSDTDAFLATDADNEWRDGAVVDAHAYSGYTYDYYFKEFGRRGLDDNSLVAVNFVHILPQREDFSNAFYDPVDDSMNYGDGDGVTFNYFSSALDVVSHELTHGVTDFSSQLIYLNESGALNEAFSDVISAGAEWYFQDPGQGRLLADWIEGEDLFYRFGGAIRSFENPAALGDPDHYSVRCLPPVCTEDYDNGGVHINSNIVDQAFYLMVQGGTNRTSGMTVQGIGTANIGHIESIFYRAFVFYLVPSSNFHDAREATLRAAGELFGSGSAEQSMVQQGWDAVGVP